jgi:hypothetical protein
MASRAPKQWSLTKTETISSFESWRNNLIYTLTLDSNFAPFTIPGATWLKRTRTDRARGLVADANAADGKSAEQKVVILELMLGQIANFCPIISRQTIVTNSTSLDHVWQSIRAHYGFQTSGARFLDIADIKLEHNERPEDLYQRLMAFAEDSLLSSNSTVLHHGERLTDDEEMTPTLENLITLIWLKLIHADLPKLVRQRYGTELRSQTLASIKPEISMALDSLLEELHSSTEAKVMRTNQYSSHSTNQYSSPSTSRQTQPYRRQQPTQSSQTNKNPAFTSFLSPV